jgi:hypothetical protein
MSLTLMRRRVGQLEQVNADALPFFIRRWLGQPLSAEQHVRADHEQAEARARPAIMLDELSPELRGWLSPDAELGNINGMRTGA